jgi:nucleoside-diphosphate-sugar epimerase
MRIGVTGGAGFIGGHVVETAISHGHDVTVFDRTGKMVPPTSNLILAGRAEIMLGDVRDEVSMAELAAHCDGIIHLAACLGTQETIQNPRPAADTNVTGGLNFLEACAQYKIPGVYIGVGNHWMNNSYSITKTTVERFVHMFNKERGTNVNIVRLVNAYGPRQSVAPPFGPAKVRKITPAFVCRALTGQNIEIYGDGLQVSDMVHVRDGARALVTALEYAAEGQVFSSPIEVGPVVSATVNDVALAVIDAASALGYKPVDLTHLPMRPGEVAGAKVTADTSTLELIGIDPGTLVPLEQGIMETVKWYRDNWLPTYGAGHDTATGEGDLLHECTDECTPGNCWKKDF